MASDRAAGGRSRGGGLFLPALATGRLWSLLLRSVHVFAPLRQSERRGDSEMGPKAKTLNSSSTQLVAEERTGGRLTACVTAQGDAADRLQVAAAASAATSGGAAAPVVQWLQGAFLPVGYPASVSADYLSECDCRRSACLLSSLQHCGVGPPAHQPSPPSTTALPFSLLFAEQCHQPLLFFVPSMQKATRSGTRCRAFPPMCAACCRARQCLRGWESAPQPPRP